MTYQIHQLGWLPDPPDYRDLMLGDPGVRARLNRVLPLTARGVASTSATPVGELRVDLRQWCSAIEQQGRIGSCTAQAVVGALEYFERKTRGQHVDASRMFLYRATRRYLGWEGRGDTGAFVRSAIKALRLFGTVPEAYWPYDEARFDDEPESFHYAFAQNFKALEYYRIPAHVAELQQVLNAGIPFMFGFTCFSSLFDSAVKRSGIVPYPSRADRPVGGHAVLAVGYTDSHVLFRNSWGTDWGNDGCGYLPWSYFDSRRPLGSDCWTLVNAAWVAEDEGERVDVRRLRRRSLAGEEPPQESDLSFRLARGQHVPPAREGATSSGTEKLAPRVQVSRGVDPTRDLPMRFDGRALSADSAAAVVLTESKDPVSLYLKNLELLDSFDWTLFGNATNEIYMAAVVWDLSGRAPMVWPAKPLEDTAARTYNLEKRQRVTFVGDGLQLWPSQKIRGGLYVRLILVESDDDVRAVGERLAEVHAAVKGSDLPAALAALAPIAGVSAPVVAAVAGAADLLTGVIARALQTNGDDLVALFDGTYGVENVTQSRSDRYEQGGARIELAFQVQASS